MPVALAPGESEPPIGIRRIHAASRTSTHEASDVAVAVIDTGIDLGHSDFNAENETNCISPGSQAQDDNATTPSSASFTSMGHPLRIGYS